MQANGLSKEGFESSRHELNTRNSENPKNKRL